MAVACQAMDIARKIIQGHQPEVVSAKGDRDMVSDIDVQIEHAVRDYLQEQHPDIGFLGEEEGSRPGKHGLQWVLDPIDGTANFVKGIPLYSISLALVSHQEPVLGIIDIPAHGSRYSAALQQGAYHDKTRIHVRPTGKLNEAIITVGDYAVGSNAGARNQIRLAVTSQLAHKALRVRMLGSAAIDLAWLAHGRTDAAIIFGNKPWDTAAGVILVREAGGSVVDLDGYTHTLHSASTVAASPLLLEQALSLIPRPSRG
jgi:myo-inositol-1(or 4)-monophosphatase